MEGLVHLQDNGLKNCILDKQSIVLCAGKVKVIDSALVSRNVYQELLGGDSEEVLYLAPELLKVVLSLM